MARVKIDISGDGSGFHKAMAGVEERLRGLKSKVGFSFGETFAALAGGATITAMIDNMANFAKEINNASRNLGVTTERVQQLRVAARHAGKDLSVFEGIFSKSESFASKALVPNSKEANIAARLGITPGDLSGPNGLSKDALVSKMLKGTGGMSRNVAEQLIGGVVGKKNAGFLVGNKDEITGKSGIGTVSNEDLNKMTELKENFEDLIDVVRIRMIPVFNDVVDAAEKFIAWASDALTINKGMSDAKEKFASQNGTRAGGWRTAAIEASTGLQLLGATVAHGTGISSLLGKIAPGKFGESLEHDYDTILNKHDELKYGKGVNDSAVVAKAASSVVAKVASTREDLERAAAARRARHKEEQAEMNGPTTRERPTKRTNNSLVLGEEGGGGSANSMLRIGGLMGVDSTYRLERVGNETNKLLRQIRDRLAPETEQADISGFLDDNMN
jgi:hypothetical protein